MSNLLIFEDMDKNCTTVSMFCDKIISVTTNIYCDSNSNKLMCDICVIDITGKKYRAGIISTNSILKEDNDATMKLKETANEVVCKMMKDMQELKNATIYILPHTDLYDGAINRIVTCQFTSINEHPDTWHDIVFKME